MCSVPRYLRLGGCAFYGGDIVCPRSGHVPRTAPLRNPVCCLAMGLLSATDRALARLDLGHDPEHWAPHRIARARGEPPPNLPDVPCDALQGLGAGGAVEGVVATLSVALIPWR